MQNNAPSSSRPLTSRMPGQLHTPTHSFSEAAFTPDSASEIRPVTWNDKRSKEDFDLARARLADQKFNMSESPLSSAQVVTARGHRSGTFLGLTVGIHSIVGDYEDPLLPRQYPQSHYYPKGVTAEIEARLLAIIAQAKGYSA